MSDGSARGILLAGPDGANPLGFLTGLGCLRAATLAWPEREVRLAWRPYGAGWRPVLHMDPGVDEEALVQGVHGYCRYGVLKGGSPGQPPPPADAFPEFTLDKNTSKIPPETFAGWAEAAASAAAPVDRRFADFIAAIGSEACTREGFVEDTAFRTMSGSGHQHFLETMLNLVEAVEPEHIRSALLEPWRYEDPLARLSMRWDPADLKQYALQWDDPSSDPTRAKRGSVLGANRLAVEALPLFATMPERRPGGSLRARTTGFEATQSEPHWTWPIWEDPVGLDTCTSLLASPALQVVGTQTAPGAPPARSDGQQGPERAREELRRAGVVEVFRSRRVSVDYYRNFTPGRAV